MPVEQPRSQTMPITPSQTVGPYFAIGLVPRDIKWNVAFGNDLVTPDAIGERITIEGAVLDGDGAPVNDCMLEIWQADASGRYAHPADDQASPNAGFRGFGRTGTDPEGRFLFHTIKPGRVAGPDGSMQAPHILVAVFARGMLSQRYTRIYLAGEPENDLDPILALVPTERRHTLIAKRRAGSGPPVYLFEIRLQGEDETVFFDV